MKFMLYVVVAVLVVGIWFGLNLANDRPLTSNPFEEDSVRAKAERAAEELGDKAKEATEGLLEEGKRSLRESLE